MLMDGRVKEEKVRKGRREGQEVKRKRRINNVNTVLHSELVL